MVVMMKHTTLEIKVVEGAEMSTIDSNSEFFNALQKSTLVRTNGSKSTIDFARGRRIRRPRKKTVMIIDKENVERKKAEESLTNEGYNVLTCSNNKECLGLLRIVKIDLVLSELILPNVFGWELFKQIKNQSTKTKTAFFTSLKELSSVRVERLKARGIDDYINKPFDRNDLIQRVNLMLSQ